MNPIFNADSELQAVRERLNLRRRAFWQNPNRPKTLLDGRDYQPEMRKRSNDNGAKGGAQRGY